MPTREPSTDEEIVRLLVAHLRLRVETQSQAVAELDRAGFGPSRIAELLGTTQGAVNQALVRARKARVRTDQGGSGD